MQKMKYILVLSSLFVLSAQAQYSDNYSQYHKDVLGRYQGFRNSVLADYAEFLEGVWTEYNTFRGEKRDAKPKPIVLPKVEDNSVTPLPVDIPVPDTPAPNVPIEHVPEITPIPVAPIVRTIKFKFYGMSWTAPEFNLFRIKDSGESKDIAAAWRYYQQNGGCEVIPMLKSLAYAKGLNDWFAFQMVRQYADEIARDGSNADKIVLQHFLLSNWGVDVRIARTSRQMVLLVPFCQKVYGRSYLSLNGKMYYLIFDEVDGIEEDAPTLYTCVVPDNVDCGRNVNLLLVRDIQISSDNYQHRKLSDGNISVEGDINVTLMEMLRHYPQMDVPEYAKSSVLATFRHDVLKQLKSQIEGLSHQEVANRLLHFVQYAFDYAKDDEQHGYEKAYFFEENFYYPQNDCEDRAIFYAYLIRELLGFDVHLIEYPGHECTAVSFQDNEIGGDGYEYEGKRFVICDPTYIGASIGMCMPDYKNTKPIIELWY